MNKQYSLYTDGGARGNPGPAAIGGVIFNDTGKIVKEFFRYLGETTNNQAEYRALIFGLEQVGKIVGAKEMLHIDLRVFLDSELVVRHLKGEYRVRDAKLKPLFIKAQKLAQKFGHTAFAHVRREKNQLADRLVNRELDRR